MSGRLPSTSTGPSRSPGPSISPGPSSAPSNQSRDWSSRPRERPSKREQVAAACIECRSKKVKCDAARPSCGRCTARSLSCYYDIEPDITRANALKRKHEHVQDDLDRMTELYEHVRSQPDAEATEIFRQIRLTPDPFTVLQNIRNGKLSLQRTVPKLQSVVFMRQLDAEALQQSRIRVRARPWTSVVGDGIVSHLLTRALQHHQLVFIDEEALTTDMLAQHERTPYCSALLVNVLCLLGTIGSRFAEAIDSGTDGPKLRDRFFREARDLLDREQGKASLPTTQALYLLYLYSAVLGMDRGGLVFRLLGVHMYQKLKLGTHLLPLQPGYNELLHRRVCSRNAWGLFCMDSIAAYMYLQHSSIPIPRLPHYFVENAAYGRANFTSIMTREDVLEAVSHLTSIFYRIATYKPREQNALGSDGDIRTRQRLYDALTGWNKVLPPQSRYGSEQAVHHHLFRAHFHVFSMILWRPLQHITVRLESGYTPAETCLSHCNKVLEELDQNFQAYPDQRARDGPMFLWCLYMMSVTMVFMLRRYSDSIGPLLRVSGLLHSYATLLPTARLMLRAIFAISMELQVDLPSQTRQHCVDVAEKYPIGDDVPISWVVPHFPDLQVLDGQNDFEDGEGDGVDAGNLIAKWAASMHK